MKTVIQANYQHAFKIIVLFLLFNQVNGQVTLPASSPYTQDFNTTPGAAGTTYPTGWASYDNTTVDAAMVVGNAASNAGANYNYVSRIGLLGSNAAFDPASIVLTIANTSNKANLTISYNVIKIREQARSVSFNLEISTTSATTGFTAVTGGTYASAALAEGTSTAYTNLNISALDNKSTNVWIRWSYATIGGSGSRDGIALDNVSIGFEPFTTWNGAAWSNSAPTATVNAIMNGNYNTTTNGAITCKNLTLTSGNLSITSAGINVKGTISKTSGTANAENGDVTFSGTTSQSIPSGFFSNNTIKNLTLNNTSGLTLNGTTNSTGVLTVTAGTLSTGGFLVLKSNSLGTSRIAPLAGSAAINGAVTVERYIPQGKRAFRFLTPGVTTTDFIANNWQLGTHITGSISGANGFDATLTGNASMYTYNNTIASGTGWSAIPNTNATNLRTGMGYRMLIRGDRNVDLGQTSAADMNSDVILSAKGTLLTGQVIFNTASNPAINGTTNTTTNGFSLVGNPYVSPIDWHLVTKSGLEQVYYGWDPNMGTATQRGRYVAYSQTTGMNNLPESEIDRYIQPGQAFFVKNTVLGTAGTLTFNETNKASNFASVFRSNADNVQNAALNVAVYDTAELSTGYPIDGTLAVFGNDFAPELGLGDVEKLYTSGEHLGFFRENKLLTIEALAPVVENDELQLRILFFQANKSYTFKIKTQSFDSDANAYLFDQFLNIQTPIDFTQDNFISFSTTADANSYANDRFKIVFTVSPLGIGNWELKSVSLYPNPIKDNGFTIALPNTATGAIKISICNMVGQKIYETTTEAKNTIKVTPTVQMSKGIYVVEIENGNQSVKQKIAVK